MKLWLSHLMSHSLVVFGGDKYQTRGGLNKEAEDADAARQKLRFDSEQLQPMQVLRKLRSFLLVSNSYL